MGRKYKRMKMLKIQERIAQENAFRSTERVAEAIQHEEPIPEVKLKIKTPSETKLKAAEKPKPKRRRKTKKDAEKPKKIQEKTDDQ